MMRCLAVALLVASTLPPGRAAAQANPAVTPPRDTAITAPPPAPVIVAYDVSVCAQPGARVTVRGSHFAPRGRRRAVLGGQGIHVDLEVLRWQDSSLTLMLPRDTRIRPGLRYFIGIEAEARGPWISNIDRPLVICGDPRPAPARVEPTPVPGSLPPPGSTPEPRDDDAGQVNEPPPVPRDDGVDPVDARPPADGGDAGTGSEREGADNPFAASPPVAAGATPTAAPLLQPASGAADPDDVEPGELLVWHPDLAAAEAFAQQLSGAGYSVRRRRVLDGLGVVQTTVGLPPGTPVATARRRLEAMDPQLLVDANHRYVPLAAAEEEGVLQLVGWSPPARSCRRSGRVGIVDTHVDSGHPVFAGRDLVVEDVLPAGIEAADARHGTAVGTRLASLAPGAALRAAAVFRQRERDVVDTTAEWLLLALDWLMREQVVAVNLSLGGPENRLLAAGVGRLVERGVGVVASVGDGGPRSAAVYPSALPGVIGVTAVDRERRVYRQARQGDEVDLAAPGVDLLVTTADGRGAYLTGTSYATPFVTAAWLLAGGGEVLFDTAEDLGAPGRDAVYGAGLLRFDGLCDGGDRGQ